MKTTALSYGFRTGCMADGVAAILRQLIRAADVWGLAKSWGTQLLVAGSPDMHSASHEVSHGMECQMLAARNVSLALQGALYRENVGTKVMCEVYLEKGCIPGRSGIPGRFRMVLDEFIGAAQAKWEEACLGVRWAPRVRKC